jgi:hypothetical protein
MNTQKSYLVKYTVGRWPNVSTRSFSFQSYIDALKYSNLLRRGNNQPTIEETTNN